MTIVPLFASAASAASLFVPLLGLSGPDSASAAFGIAENGEYVIGSAYPFNLETDEPVRWNAAGQVASLRGIPAYDGVKRIAGQISGDGDVAIGIVVDPESDPHRREAFRWTATAGIASLGTLPGADHELNTAVGVSLDGAIVVGTTMASTGDPQGYRWTAETGMVSLGTLRPTNTGWSSAHAITGDGRVIVGDAASEFGSEPFRWTADGMVGLGDLPGGVYGGYAASVSADGNVIVGASYSAISGGTLEAFRWTEATGMQPLGFLNPDDIGSSAGPITADGKVIFGSSGFFERRGFVWDERHGMRDVRQMLDVEFGMAETLAGWRLSHVGDVSADGRSLVGIGVNPNGVTQGWLIRLDRPINVPEPASASLLAAAMAFACARARGPSGINNQ